MCFPSARINGTACWPTVQCDLSAAEDRLLAHCALSTVLLTMASSVCPRRQWRLRVTFCDIETLSWTVWGIIKCGQYHLDLIAINNKMVLKIDTFYNFTPPVVVCLAGVHKIVLGLLLSLPGVHQLPAVLDAEDDLVVIVLHLPVESVFWISG